MVAIHPPVETGGLLATRFIKHGKFYGDYKNLKITPRNVNLAENTRKEVIWN